MPFNPDSDKKRLQNLKSSNIYPENSKILKILIQTKKGIKTSNHQTIHSENSEHL